MQGGKASNFGHLQAHDEQLVRLGMLAERYFAEDPNTCLLKLRQLAELLAQLAASNVGIFTSPGERQVDLLRRLQDQGIVPREVGALFAQVCKSGNDANHGLGGDLQTRRRWLQPPRQGLRRPAPARAGSLQRRAVGSAMRANMPQFGKRTPFTRDYFRTGPGAPAEQARDKFEDVFGDDPTGGPAALAARQDPGPTGRWHRFTRKQIAPRGDNLDISWLKDDSAQTADAQRDDPAMVACLLQRELGDAMAKLRALLEELSEDPDAPLDDLPVDEPQADETPT